MAGFLPEYKRTAREDYRGHDIQVVFYQPDMGLQVDGETVGNFFFNTRAALAAGHRHVDDLIKAKEKKR